MSHKFSATARWIWDDSDPFSLNYYLKARRCFSISSRQFSVAGSSGMSHLLITADAHYQVAINGAMVGHGPAKSAEGERFIDTYDIGKFLLPGENTIKVLVLSVGVGTMSYCLGEAGLIFEVRLPKMIVVSDSKTLVQRDAGRLRKTVRRWVLPDIEDVDASKASSHWRPARVIAKTAKLTPRPVPHPSRQILSQKHLISRNIVKFPQFSCTFKIKSYLVEPGQVRRWNTYGTPAYIVTDLVSPCDQTITWLPAPASVTWYYNKSKVMTSTGWGRGDESTPPCLLRLKKGANRLVGIHGLNHFEEIHLAAFTEHPITVRNPFGAGAFQVISTDGESLPCRDHLPADFTDRVARGNFLKMNPKDTLPDANFQDLVVNAVVCREASSTAVAVQTPSGWKISGTGPGMAARVIIDLGMVHNGWLSFQAFGKPGSRLIFSFFEALEVGPELRINWPAACNNAVSYRLRKGWQKFESFFAYGVRYIAIHHQGVGDVELQDLQILSANCGHLSQGAFRSDNIALNGIYAMCEQTVISATDDTLTDCPTYEAVNWNFDNRLGAMAALMTTRNIALIRNTIDQYARDPYYPGLVRSHYPSTWENRIPVFSFHWIIFCQEFYWHTGDNHFLKAVFPQVRRGIEEALGMLDSSGLLQWPASENPWHIIDWHSQRDDNHPIVSAEQAIFLGALEAAALLADESSQAQNAKRWRAVRDQLRKALHECLWVKERDAYADSIHADGRLSPVSSQASNAALALYGLGTGSWKQRLAKRLGNEECSLLPCGSPMGLFYVLEFLDSCGEVETIFQTILKKWGPMLEAGDMTTWEQFPEKPGQRIPTRSRCHPFSSYILKYFGKYLLGVESCAKGMNVIRFKPAPPSCINKCEGVIPAAHGVIRVGWSRRGNRIESEIDAPGGMSVQRP
jgi:alpha-L-rhamnosidase